MFDRHEIQLIALAMEDGSVAVMQFITKAWNSKRKPSMAPILGMLDGSQITIAEPEPSPEDALIYSREATDEAIEAEIAKSVFGLPVVSWRRVSPDDLPRSRENREAWRDDGRKIAVDPGRVKPKEQTLEQRITALESGLKLTR